jgi:O-antigen biosynthesis protein
LVGKVPLAELPGLIAGCSLFLGNDSGPKHVAAGLGVPTVGVHAGTVDVREWGPVGPAAVAVARSVVCSPCYLSQAGDCRRGLVCIRRLEPAQVYEACLRLLPLGAPGRAVPRPIERPARAASSPERRGPRRPRRPAMPSAPLVR